MTSIRRRSARPHGCCVIPSTCDLILAPEGRFVATCFVKYSREKPTRGLVIKNRRFGRPADRAISEYAPNFKNSMEHRQVLNPGEVADRFGLIGGNIFHGAMSLDQLFSFQSRTGSGELPHAGGRALSENVGTTLSTGSSRLASNPLVGRFFGKGLLPG